MIASLKRSPNLVIEAPPGAGKTTRVPPALLEIVSGEVVVLEPRRIAARLAARRVAWEIGEPVGQTPRRQSGRNPPRFQNNHFTTDNFQQSRRHAGRLTRARRCLNDKVRRALERRNHLRQNRVHRKYRFVDHQFSSKHAPSPASTPCLATTSLSD